MTTKTVTFLDRVRALFPPEYREAAYRAVAGIATLLAGTAFLSQEEAALWTQLGLSSVTLLFAALYATSTWRLVLYPVLAAVGPLLVWYGVVSDESWPLILQAAVQIFGLSTAAAKVVQAPHRGLTGPSAVPPPTLAA